MTTALAFNVRDRLAKLLPLLSSDKDGEVVAAARAISRTLTAAGSDWHGLVAAMVVTRTGWRPSKTTSGAFNYADTFQEADPLFEGPEHPEALSRRFGLAIYSTERIEPWPEVARHCLKLNQTLPKKHGGKRLETWQKDMLRTFVDDRRQPTNRQVEWIQKLLARLHQARDAARPTEKAQADG